MRTYVAMKLLASTTILAHSGGCNSETPQSGPTNGISTADVPGTDKRQSRKIKLALINFYDTRATVFVNSKTVFDGELDVREPSVGISNIFEVEVTDTPKVRLLSGKIDIEKTLNITPESRMIVIDPTTPPYLTVSRSEELLMD